MKRHLVVLMALFVGLATPVVACDDMEDQAYLLDEVLRLSYEGVPDRIIIKQMQTMDFVFCISADDIIELRGLGVSDEVIEAIIETSLVVEEQRAAETRVTVRVSPGYWSPWYRYPSAWGAYYDPFPVWYSYYYYPFLYNCGNWYGWAHGSYYYAYHWYDYDYYYHPHDNDYRNEPSYPDHLAVVGGRGAQQVAMPPSAIPQNGAPAVVARPVSTPATTAAGSAGLTGRVDGDKLAVSRTPYRAADVTTPPRRTSATGRQETLRSARSPELTVRQPAAATPMTPTSPAEQARVEPKRTLTGAKAPTPAVRPARSATTVDKRTPQRLRPAARRATPSQRVTAPAQRTPTRVTTPPKRTPTRVTNPPKRTPTRVTNPPKRTPTRVTNPPKRTPTRVKTPPKRTPTPQKRTAVRAPTRVKAPPAAAPRRAPARSAPPKASRPKSR